jgi:hypothetical protein
VYNCQESQEQREKIPWASIPHSPSCWIKPRSFSTSWIFCYHMRAAGSFTVLECLLPSHITDDQTFLLASAGAWRRIASCPVNGCTVNALPSNFLPKAAFFLSFENRAYVISASRVNGIWGENWKLESAAKEIWGPVPLIAAAIAFAGAISKSLELLRAAHSAPMLPRPIPTFLSCTYEPNRSSLCAQGSFSVSHPPKPSKNITNYGFYTPLRFWP